MTNHATAVFQFDDIRVEPHTFKVLKAGTPVELEPKTFLLLTFLIENRDRLVEKREILDVIWKDVAVTENALTREIGKLRKSLGDDAKAAKYIQTVHTRGYRFIAPVEVVETNEEEPPPMEPGRPVMAKIRIPARLFSKVLVTLGAVVVLAAGVSLLRNNAAANRSWTVPRLPATLAVLPFQSLGAGPNDQYVGLAIADALITKLSGNAKLAVQPTSTVFHYVDTKQDSLAIGRAMRVDYVLEGKFQTRNEFIRVTVQLLCVSCDKPSRWAASFDENSQDIFRVEDSISERVVGALMLELNGEQQKRLRKHETSDPTAHVAFARAKGFMAKDNKEGLTKAIELFELAVRRDPDYAAAWAQLSDCYRRLEWYGAPPSEGMAKSTAAAMKAVALDDSESYGHSMLGFVAFQYDWDFATAEREYKRALELQPGFVHQWYARQLLALNRVSEAESEYRRFLQKLPFSILGGTNVAQFEFLTRQYDRSREQLRGTLQSEPGYPPAHEVLGLVYQQQGLTSLALQELQTAVELSGGNVGLGSLGNLYAVQGDDSGVQRVLRDLAQQSKQRYVAPFDFALIHAGRGENHEAMRELERAYSERSLSAQALRFDPRLEKLRNEPRYQEFVKRIGLPF